MDFENVPLIVALIKALTKKGGGGGGSGSYTDLSNKPKINGVVLSGDKSTADLGIVTAPVMSNGAVIFTKK